MFRKILLLIILSSPTTSYSQRVTEGLLQELYYVDGDLYSVNKYAKDLESYVSVTLKDITLPKNYSFTKNISFSVQEPDGVRHFNFDCYVLSGSVNEKNPTVKCNNLSAFPNSPVSSYKKVIDVESNKSRFESNYYKFDSGVVNDTFHLYDLLSIPKVLTRSNTGVTWNIVEKTGNITTTTQMQNGRPTSRTISEKLPNGDIEETFKWLMLTHKKNKPYSSLRLIQTRGDSTIKFTRNRLSHFAAGANEHVKSVEVKDSKGNLTFEGKYIGKKELFQKQVKYIPEYEIEYKYYGKKLERRTIKTPTDTTLIEIRRKYAEPTQ